MSETNLKSIIEGFIFASDKAVSVDRLQSFFPENEQPEKEEVLAALEALQQDYEGRGIELKKVSSGYRFQVRSEFTPWVSRLWEEKPARYTRALLETLALIVYRQPITRGEIEEIRGVAVSSNIIKTLQEREWIKSVGHKDVPGRPALYASTKEFLDYFNLESLDQLPPLSEIKDLDTIAKELNPEENADLIEAINEMKAEEAASAEAEQNVGTYGEAQAESDEENVEDIIKKAAELAASVANSTDQYIAESEAIISGKPTLSDAEETASDESTDDEFADDQTSDASNSLDSSEEEAKLSEAEEAQESEGEEEEELANQAEVDAEEDVDVNADASTSTSTSVEVTTS